MVKLIVIPMSKCVLVEIDCEIELKLTLLRQMFTIFCLGILWPCGIQCMIWPLLLEIEQVTWFLCIWKPIIQFRSNFVILDGYCSQYWVGRWGLGVLWMSFSEIQENVVFSYCCIKKKNFLLNLEKNCKILDLILQVSNKAFFTHIYLHKLNA